jgi:hypothetical protein
MSETSALRQETSSHVRKPQLSAMQKSETSALRHETTLLHETFAVGQEYSNNVQKKSALM